MIYGVKVKQLRAIPDERGRLMEVLRSDEPFFEGFGQVYVTTCLPGFAKAWHYHRIQSDFFTCVKGRMRLVLFDSREGSPTRNEIQEFVISMDENPVLVKIPPGVYHGFECASAEEAVVVNIPDRSYNRPPFSHEKPDEYRLPFDAIEIPYKWKANKGG